MIERLRKRFIRIATLAVAGVLLLLCVTVNAANYISADRIMEKIWGWDSDAEINVVWVHISNLRKKLKAVGSGVSICANRGLGYILEGKS